MIDYKEVLQDVLDPLKFDIIELKDCVCKVRRIEDDRIFRCEWMKGPHNEGYRMFLQSILFHTHKKNGSKTDN